MANQSMGMKILRLLLWLLVPVGDTINTPSNYLSFSNVGDYPLL
jgi:hypothetical protein